MLLKPRKWARLSALALVCASIGVAAFAAQVTPPDNASAQQVNVSPGVLASYAGYYQPGPYASMSIKVDGAQLSAQLTGQGPVPFYPSSANEFFARLVKAQISFVHGAQGEVTALVLHQNGHEVNMPRIDAFKAEAIQRALDARVKAQQPLPGSEQALQIVLSGTSDSPRLNPQLAEARRMQKARIDAYLAPLGAITSHEFTGVTPQGWDKYLVRHEHGTEEVAFLLDEQGMIVGAYRRP